MTLIQAILGKLGAALAGALAFFALWTTVDGYPMILGIIHEQTAFSVAACILVTLGADAAIIHYQLKTGEKLESSGKSLLPDQAGPSSFYQCAKCGNTFEQPIRIKEFGTDKVLYMACPGCRAPIQQPAQTTPPPAATTQPAAPSPPQAPQNPATAGATAMDPPKEPEPPKEKPKVKPLGDVEVQPDGSVLVNGILIHAKKS